MTRPDSASAKLDPKPQLGAAPLQTSREQVPHAQLATDLVRRQALALEQKDRMAGDHQEIAEPAEIGDDVPGDTVTEMLVAWIPGQVVQGQHGDRGLLLGADRQASATGLGPAGEEPTAGSCGPFTSIAKISIGSAMFLRV